jgi:hypothetical protein
VVVVAGIVGVVFVELRRTGPPLLQAAVAMIMTAITATTAARTNPGAPLSCGPPAIGTPSAIAVP